MNIMRVAIAMSALPSVVLLGAQSQPGYFAASLHEQLACAPQLLTSDPLPGMRVIGNQDRNRQLFATGDGIIVDAGSTQGIKTGQQYFVRRIVRDEFVWPTMAGEQQSVSVHTAGWVTIVEVRDNLSAAQVTHACDGIIAGDYLEPFVEPADPPAVVEGAPDYEHPARIVMGDERRQTGSAGTLMMLDRGSNNDVRPGQTVTIFREPVSGLGPIYQVGRGTLVDVRPQSSLLRIDSTREAVYIGDFAAVNRLSK